MITTIDHEIKYKAARQDDIRQELADLEESLIKLNDLRNLILANPHLAVFKVLNGKETVEAVASDKDKVIADAVQDAENIPLEIYLNLYHGADNAINAIKSGSYYATAEKAEKASGFMSVRTVKLVEEKPEEAIKDSEGSERDPIRFFASVREENNEVYPTGFKSYRECSEAVNVGYRAGEFMEVMPDDHVDKEYFWRNIYIDKDEESGLRVGLPYDSLAEAVNVCIYLDNTLLDTVKIRRNKKC